MRITVVEAAVARFHDLATNDIFLGLLHHGGDFAYNYLIQIHQRYSLATWKIEI